MSPWCKSLLETTVAMAQQKSPRPGGSQIAFYINNKSSKGNSYTVSVGGFQASDKVVEVLGCKTNTDDSFGNSTMYMGQVRYPLTSVLLFTSLPPAKKKHPINYIPWYMPR
ncbi:hypothetical protein IFM46972_11447 [Aspergillus udagawae]|uniref:Alpha-amylase domain-containing protein n=1 Tax=Aspergillus udagawae TaxID=91492 RepID=A0A8H3SGN2_9EURO|nr:hypothetical protein IFM46972_11447 [Aspergillus udagawae]